MKGSLFSKKVKDSADIDSLTKSFGTTEGRTDTIGSTLTTNSSSSSSSDNLKSITSSLSSLSHSLLPHKHSHHHHHRHQHQHSTSSNNSIELPEDPIEFAFLAFNTLLSYPGPTIDSLRNEILPLFFHELYVHRVNTRETDLAGMLNIIENVFRSRFKKVSLRIKGDGIIDKDGSASIDRAAVGIMYDLIAVPAHAKNEIVEDRKSTVMAVVKIVDGRIAQSDVVIDTLPFQVRSEKELSCCIM